MNRTDASSHPDQKTLPVLKVTRMAGGASSYHLDGKPLLARCPVVGLEAAREDLNSFGVTMRIDLRDPDNEIDAGKGPSDWPLMQIPVPMLNPSREDWPDHANVYHEHRDAIMRAAGHVSMLIAQGTVPLVHCKIATDRTGTVVAALLLPYWSLKELAEEYVLAGKHAGHEREAAEILPYLNWLSTKA